MTERDFDALVGEVAAICGRYVHVDRPTKPDESLQVTIHPNYLTITSVHTGDSICKRIYRHGW